MIQRLVSSLDTRNWDRVLAVCAPNFPQLVRLSCTVCAMRCSVLLCCGVSGLIPFGAHRVRDGGKEG